MTELSWQDLLFFCLIRCHAVNVSDNAAYFYNKINEDLNTGGLDVKAEDIIDIIDGYKGRGYALSTQEELGGYQRHYYFFYWAIISKIKASVD